MTASLLDPRNGPAHDLPPLDGPPRTYVIASVPRSGSTLLARLLWDTGRVGAPKEYLNPMQLRDWQVRGGASVSRWIHRALSGRAMGAVVGRGWSQDRLRRHLEMVQRVRSSGGWFGLKLHHHHLLRVGGMASIEALLGEVRWIRIRRADRVAQALSWHRALGTGRWASWQEELRPARYSRTAIASRLAAIEAAEQGWDRSLEGLPVHQVTCEDLVADPVEMVRDVLAWLDVSRADQVDVPAPSLRRQADSLTQDWRSRWDSGN